MQFSETRLFPLISHIIKFIKTRNWGVSVIRWHGLNLVITWDLIQNPCSWMLCSCYYLFTSSRHPTVIFCRFLKLKGLCGYNLYPGRTALVETWKLSLSTPEIMLCKWCSSDWLFKNCNICLSETIQCPTYCMQRVFLIHCISTIIVRDSVLYMDLGHNCAEIKMNESYQSFSFTTLHWWY